MHAMIITLPNIVFTGFRKFFLCINIIMTGVRMGKLADEKTLELNITHELLSGAGIGAFGFTQDEENKLSGGDVLFPCSIPLILQFKAPFQGVDNIWGDFHLNSNKNRNQHMMLHAWSQSGLCKAVYVFPLIITDIFLTSNFGNLLDFSEAIDADWITDSHNWDKPHRITVRKNFSFQVHSEESNGEGYPARKLIDYLNKNKLTVQSDRPISKYLPMLIEKMERTAKQFKIFGGSEHTLYIMATTKRREEVGYLALPIVIKGLENEVTFT
jgi:hypothetical protein